MSRRKAMQTELDPLSQTLGKIEGGQAGIIAEIAGLREVIKEHKETIGVRLEEHFRQDDTRFAEVKGEVSNLTANVKHDTEKLMEKFWTLFKWVMIGVGGVAVIAFLLQTLPHWMGK